MLATIDYENDHRLMPYAWWLLLVVRIGLWTLGFRRLYPYLQRCAQRHSSEQSTQIDVEQIVRAVTLSGRYVPRGRICLCQALAAYYLLVRNGHSAELCFGALKDPDRAFLAHAWVEIDGKPVICADTLELFTPLRRPNAP